MAGSSKKLLFLCSPFFGYYKHIKAELEQQGFEVDHFNDRPSESQIQKGLIRLFPFLVYTSVISYFKKILKKTNSRNYDIILIINNKVLTEGFLQSLHKAHPKAYFIFYTWDPVHLYPSTVNLLSYFDISYSFDLNDCELINGLNHLALFYTQKHQEIREFDDKRENKVYTYDIMHVGTAHPNRYEVLNKLIPYLVNQKIEFFSYIYIQPVRFAFYKIFVREFKHAKINEFKYFQLPEDKMIELYKHSKVVFDIPHFGQAGLTIRTIETLGTNRKLITYNKYIEYYDFYNKNNILILNDNNWDQIESFIKSDYQPVSNEIYLKYSLTNWIKTLLETWVKNEEGNQ
jgi:hypothetical protein